MQTLLCLAKCYSNSMFENKIPNCKSMFAINTPLWIQTHRATKSKHQKGDQGLSVCLSEYLKGHSGHQVLPGPSRAFQESSRAFLEYSRTFKGLPRIFQAFKRLLGVFQGILGPFKRLSGLSTVFQSLQWPSNV